MTSRSDQQLSGESLQTFRLISPAVDFIENRMPQYHEAFDTRGFRYSPDQNQFVALATSTAMSRSANLLSASQISSPPARPSPSSINDMSFWSEVLPQAMKRLNEEPLPKGGYHSEWGIRHSSTWHDIQAKLDIARREYEFRHSPELIGKLRRKLREGSDQVIVPLQQGVQLIPNMDMTSPVIGVMKLVLGVSQTV